MSEKIELKTCPFCGGKAMMAVSEPGHEDRVWFLAKCRELTCLGGNINRWEYTKERAAAAWNRRAKCEN